MLGLREYLYLAAIALLCGAVWWFGWHERRIGEQVVEKHDAVAVVVQEKHDAKADTDAIAGLQQQNVALAQWISDHPQQPLIVRRGPSCNAQGDTVAPANSAADVPAGTGAGVREPDSIDIGPRVRLLAIVAERAAAFDTACEATVAGRAR